MYQDCFLKGYFSKNKEDRSVDWLAGRSKSLLPTRDNENENWKGHWFFCMLINN